MTNIIDYKVCPYCAERDKKNNLVYRRKLDPFGKCPYCELVPPAIPTQEDIDKFHSFLRDNKFYIATSDKYEDHYTFICPITREYTVALEGYSYSGIMYARFFCNKCRTYHIYRHFNIDLHSIPDEDLYKLYRKWNVEILQLLTNENYVDILNFVSSYFRTCCISKGEKCIYYTVLKDPIMKYDNVLSDEEDLMEYYEAIKPNIPFLKNECKKQKQIAIREEDIKAALGDKFLKENFDTIYIRLKRILLKDDIIILKGVHRTDNTNLIIMKIISDKEYRNKIRHGMNLLFDDHDNAYHNMYQGKLENRLEWFKEKIRESHHGIIMMRASDVAKELGFEDKSNLAIFSGLKSFLNKKGIYVGCKNCYDTDKGNKFIIIMKFNIGES